MADNELSTERETGLEDEPAIGSAGMHSGRVAAAGEVTHEVVKPGDEPAPEPPNPNLVPGPEDPAERTGDVNEVPPPDPDPEPETK